MAKAARATEPSLNSWSHFIKRDDPHLPAKGLYRPDYVQRR
jgi:hypothetical protein